MTKFEKDLKTGGQAEKFILGVIQRVYPSAELVDEKSHDIWVPEAMCGIEVKFDRGSRNSANFVVEASYRGKRSGIFEDSDYWAQIYFSDTLGCWVYFIIPTVEMRIFSEQEGVLVLGGDDKLSELYKIRKVNFEKIYRGNIKKVKA